MFLLYILIWFIGLCVIASPFFIVRFLTVQEGYAVIFKSRGRFVLCAMEFAEHHFNADGDIVAGPGPNSYGSCFHILRFGGWIVYFWPFVKPAKYLDYNEIDGFGEGVYIRLGDVASNPFTSEAETTEPPAVPGEQPGSVGVDVKFTSKMRVINPRKFLFVSPRNVVREAVEDRQDGALRAWVFSGDVNHVQSAKGNGVAMWKELKKLKLTGSFDEARDDWGLEIVPNSIVVKSVELDPAYQAAKKARSQQELIAQGEAARIGDPIDLMMEKWVARHVAHSGGKPEEEVVAELKTSGEYQRKERALEDLRTKALASNFSRVETDISSGGGPLPDGISVLSLGGGGAGVFAGAGRGGPRPPRNANQQNPRNPRVTLPPDDDDDDGLPPTPDPEPEPDRPINRYD